MMNPTLLKSVALALPFATLLALPTPARALDLGLRLEPALTMPLSEPQSDRFELGGSLTVKGYLGILRFFDIQGGISLLRFNASSEVGAAAAGEAWSTGLGVRLKRPHDAASGGSWVYAASPWVDADALYVRTGGLDRFGFAAGAGVAFPIDPLRNFWIGPFVRYMQIVQPDRLGFDSRDASLFLVGITFEIGSNSLRELLPAAAEVPVSSACPSPVNCANRDGLASRNALGDRDNDGLLDVVDLCPDVAGSVDNHGCRVYKRVIVKLDKLELTEKIMFASDDATIESVSFPLLDEVVQALQDNKSFRVRMEGHADSSGPDAHNQTLSEQRAAAVLDYLQSHGVAKERLTSKGFSSSEPTVSNETPEGREINRRVEFVITFMIVDRSTQ